MAGKNIIVKLDVHCDKDNKVVASFESYGSRLDFKGLSDITDCFEDVEEVTVEVRDFVQNNTVYEVYGVALADDKRSVAAHFGPLDGGNGCRHRFVLGGRDAHPGIVIGAVPRSRAVPEPIALSQAADAGGGFPVPTGGSGKGN